MVSWPNQSSLIKIMPRQRAIATGLFCLLNQKPKISDLLNDLSF